MLESLIVNKLQDLASKYLDNFDKNMLNISLGKGDVEIRNLSLRSDALQEVLPALAIKAGFLSKLKLKFSITKLKTEPIQVMIEDLLILTVSKQEIPLDEKLLKQQIQQKFKEKIKKVVEAELLEEEKIAQGDKAGKKSKFLVNLVNQIVNNLKIQIINFHIRFENLKSNLCFGISIQNISIDTVQMTKENGITTEVPVILKEDVVVLTKRLQMNCLSLYIDNQFEALSNQTDKVTVKEFLHKNIATDMNLPCFQYVVKPMFVKLLVNYDKTENNFQFMGPKFSIQAQIQNCNFHISCLQIQKTLNQIQSLTKIIIVGNIENRPNETQLSQNWWSYLLLDCEQLEEHQNQLMYPIYCQLYAHHYINFKTKFATQKQQDQFDREHNYLLSDQEQSLIDILQQSFSVKELIFCKQMVLRQLAGENFQKLKKNNYQFSISDQEIKKAILESQNNEKVDEYPLGYKLFNIAIIFNDIQLSLYNSQSQEIITKAVLSNIQIDLKKQQPDIFKCGLVIQNFELFDLTPNSKSYSTIIRKLPQNPLLLLESIQDTNFKNVDHDILFTLSFTSPSTDKNYVGELEIDSQPVSIVLTSQIMQILSIIQQEFKIFNNQEKKDIINQQSEILNKYQQIQAYSEHSLKIAKQNHKRLKISLSLNGSIVMLPTKLNQFIVINLGRFIIQTVQTDNYKELYDEFDISMSNTSLYSVQNSQDLLLIIQYLHNLNQNISDTTSFSYDYNKFDLIKPFNCVFKLIKSILPNFINTSRLKLLMDISSLKFNINDYNCQIIYNLCQELFNKKTKQKQQQQKLQDKTFQQQDKILDIQQFIVFELKLTVQSIEMVLGSFSQDSLQKYLDFKITTILTEIIIQPYSKQFDFKADQVQINDIITKVLFLQVPQSIQVQIQINDKQFSTKNNLTLELTMFDILVKYQPLFGLKTIELITLFSNQIVIQQKQVQSLQQDNSSFDSFDWSEQSQDLQLQTETEKLQRIEEYLITNYLFKFSVIIQSFQFELFSNDQHSQLSMVFNQMDLQFYKDQMSNTLKVEINQFQLKQTKEQILFCQSLNDNQMLNLQFSTSTNQNYYKIDLGGFISGFQFTFIKSEMIGIIYLLKNHLKQVQILLPQKQVQVQQKEKNNKFPLSYIDFKLDELTVVLPHSIQNLNNHFSLSITDAIIYTEKYVDDTQKFQFTLQKIQFNIQDEQIADINNMKALISINNMTQDRNIIIQSATDINLHLQDINLDKIVKIISENLLKAQDTKIDSNAYKQLQQQYDLLVTQKFNQLYLFQEKVDFIDILEKIHLIKQRKIKLVVANIIKKFERSETFIDQQSTKNLNQFQLVFKNIKASLQIKEIFYQLAIQDLDLSVIMQDSLKFNLETGKIKLSLGNTLENQTQPIFLSRCLNITLFKYRNQLDCTINVEKSLQFTVNPDQLLEVGQSLIKQKFKEDFELKQQKQTDKDLIILYNDLESQLQILKLDSHKIRMLGCNLYCTKNSISNVKLKIYLNNSIIVFKVSQDLQFQVLLQAQIDLQLKIQQSIKINDKFELRKYQKYLDLQTNLFLGESIFEFVSHGKMNQIFTLNGVTIGASLGINDRYISADVAIDSQFNAKLIFKADTVVCNIGIGSTLQLIQLYNENILLVQSQFKSLLQLQDSVLNKDFYLQYDTIVKHQSYIKQFIPLNSSTGQPVIIGLTPYCTFQSISLLNLDTKIIKVQVIFFDKQVNPQPLFNFIISQFSVNIDKALDNFISEKAKILLTLNLNAKVSSFNQSKFYFDEVLDIVQLQASLIDYLDSQQDLSIDKIQINIDNTIIQNIRQVLTFGLHLQTLLKNLQGEQQSKVELQHDRIQIANSTEFQLKLYHYGTKQIIVKLDEYQQVSIDKFSNEFSLEIIIENTIMFQIDLQIKDIFNYKKIFENIYFQIEFENEKQIFIFRQQNIIVNLSHLKLQIYNQHQQLLENYINSFTNEIKIVFEDTELIISQFNIDSIQLNNKTHIRLVKQVFNNMDERIVTYFIYPSFILQNQCFNNMIINNSSVMSGNSYFLYTNPQLNLTINNIKYDNNILQDQQIIDIFQFDGQKNSQQNVIQLQDAQLRLSQIYVLQDKTISHFQFFYKLFPQFIIQNSLYDTEYKIYLINNETVIDLTSIQFQEILDLNLKNSRIVIQYGKQKLQWDNINLLKVSSKQQISNNQGQILMLQKTTAKNNLSKIISIYPIMILRNKSKQFFNFYFFNDQKTDLLFQIKNQTELIIPIFLKKQFVYLQYEDNENYSSVINLHQKCSLSLFVPGFDSFISVQTFHQNNMLIIDVFDQPQENDSIQIQNLTPFPIRIEQQTNLKQFYKKDKKQPMQTINQNQIKGVVIQSNSKDNYSLFDISIPPVLNIQIQDFSYNLSIQQIGKRKPQKFADNKQLFIQIDCIKNTKIIELSLESIQKENILSRVFKNYTQLQPVIHRQLRINSFQISIFNNINRFINGVYSSPSIEQIRLNINNIEVAQNIYEDTTQIEFTIKLIQSFNFIENSYFEQIIAFQPRNQVVSINLHFVNNTKHFISISIDLAPIVINFEQTLYDFAFLVKDLIIDKQQQNQFEDINNLSKDQSLFLKQQIIGKYFELQNKLLDFSQIYIGNFQISQIELNLSLYLDKISLSQVHTLNSLLSTVIDPFMHLSDMRILLPEYSLQNQYMSFRELQQIITRFYMPQLLSNVSSVFAGTEFPAFIQRAFQPFDNCVDQIPNNAKQIIYLPKYLFQSLKQSIFAFPASASRILEVLTFDGSFKARQLRLRRQSEKYPSQAFKNGVASLKDGVVDGVIGIQKQPKTGMVKYGKAGFGRGMCKGIIGVAIKPVAGFLGMVSCAGLQGKEIKSQSVLVSTVWAQGIGNNVNEENNENCQLQ